MPLLPSASPGPMRRFRCFILSAGGLLFVGCWLGLTQAAKAGPLGPDGRRGFGLVDLGCILSAAIPFLVLQEQLPLLWCFSTPVVVTVMVYGTGLGREYFNYSFVPRTAKTGLFVGALLLTGLLVFFAANVILGAVSYTGNLWRSPWYQIYEICLSICLLSGSRRRLFSAWPCSR